MRFEYEYTGIYHNWCSQEARQNCSKRCINFVKIAEVHLPFDIKYTKVSVFSCSRRLRAETETMKLFSPFYSPFQYYLS
jgi:hypothetical protein